MSFGAQGKNGGLGSVARSSPHRRGSVSSTQKELSQAKQLGEDVIWGAGLYLADTPEEAKRKVEPSHDERYKWFAPFGFVRYADEHGRTWGTPGTPARVPSLADGIQQKAWLCGPPAHVIDGIRSIEAKYPGVEDFMIHWAEGLPPREFKEQLRWFARDVMPAFARG